MRIASLSLVLAALALFVGSADAAPVKVAGATASTSLPPGDGVNYNPENAFDHKQSTVWVEGDTAGSGLGAHLTLDLGGEVPVNGIKIWNGNYFSYDFWQRHNRIKELELTFSDGSTKKVTLKDEMVPEEILFDAPVNTSSIKMKIKGIYRGSTFNDTVISEVVVMDNRPSDLVPVKEITASSIYAADADGNYDPSNLTDTVLDSLWCEASEEGDGTGEWLKFDFGQSVDVSQLQLVNGNAYDFMSFMKSNSATELTLKFSDGSTQTVAVKSSPMLQKIDFTRTDTSSVLVTFAGVKKGKEFNDLCMAEAAFAN